MQDLINLGQTEAVTQELQKLIAKPGRHHTGCTSQFQWFNDGLKEGNHHGDGGKAPKNPAQIGKTE